MWSDSDGEKVPSSFAEIKDNAFQWLSRTLLKMFSKDAKCCCGSVNSTKPYDTKDFRDTKKPHVKKDVIQKFVWIRMYIDVTVWDVPKEEKQNPNFLPTVGTDTTRYWEFSKMIRFDNTPENRKFCERYQASKTSRTTVESDVYDWRKTGTPVSDLDIPDVFSPFDCGDRDEREKASRGIVRDGWRSRLVATEVRDKVEVKDWSTETRWILPKDLYEWKGLNKECTGIV